MRFACAKSSALPGVGVTLTHVPSLATTPLQAFNSMAVQDDIAQAQPRSAVAWAAAFSLALYLGTWWSPELAWLGRPLIWLSTLCHELAHGLAAILAGGELVQLSVYADGSGVATHRGAYSAFERAFVAAAGPLGPAVAGLVLLASLRHRRGARWLLGFAAATLLVVLMLWVRNVFGLAFVTGLMLSIGVAAAYAPDRWLYIAAGFLGVQMGLSTFSNMDYLFSAGAQTGAGALPSDTQQIADTLGLSYWFWGGLLALMSVATVALGLWISVRKSNSG
jgi:hypothetical protein